MKRTFLSIDFHDDRFAASCLRHDHFPSLPDADLFYPIIMAKKNNKTFVVLLLQDFVNITVISAYCALVKSAKAACGFVLLAGSG